MRPFLYTLLHYSKAIEFANDVAKLPGFQCFEYLSDLLKLDIGVTHAERIPATGGFILVSNHPTGIADGVAVFDLLKTRRPDMMFFANRDAVRVNPRFAEMIIPVEWREEYKSKLKARETLQLTNRAVAGGQGDRAVPLRPHRLLGERQAERAAVEDVGRRAVRANTICRSCRCIMTARNSGLFYWFAKWSTELRDMTVFHELLNKSGDRFDFLIGNLIPVEQLDGDVNEVTKALEKHTVFDLAADGNATFTPVSTPAAAQDMTAAVAEHSV